MTEYTYVYAVCDDYSGSPVLARATVMKRSEKQLTLHYDQVCGKAFNWRVKVAPQEVAETPEQAVLRYRDALSLEIADSEHRIKVATAKRLKTPKTLY